MAAEILAADLASQAVIDYSVLQSLSSVPNLFQETFKVVNERVGAMQRVRSLPQLEAAQIEEFSRAAHGLKSGVCMIGCNRLALLCHQMGTCDLLLLALQVVDMLLAHLNRGAELCSSQGEYQNIPHLIHLYDHALPQVLQVPGCEPLSARDALMIVAGDHDAAQDVLEGLAHGAHDTYRIKTSAKTAHVVVLHC